MVSVIIACYNDQYWLYQTIERLYEGQDPDSFEVIVVDDCSTTPIMVTDFIYKATDMKYLPVRVLRNTVHQGVGYSFDRGVKEAVGDTIVLMGSDVLVKDRSWLSEAEKWSADHPKAIGCAVCNCLSPKNTDFDAPDMKKLYGATINWVNTYYKHPFGNEFLPADYCIDIINASSLSSPIEGRDDCVPCIIGAFYVTTKGFYQYINGWDTDGGVNKGHQHWGGLEPWISIKTWLLGGECRVIRSLEVGHIFGRLTHAGGVMAQRGIRADLRWYNKLFIVHTLFTEHEKQGLLSMLNRLFKENDAYDKNYGIGLKLIRKNADWVNTVMRRNDELAVGETGYRNLDLFKRKFRMTFPWET